MNTKYIYLMFFYFKEYFNRDLTGNEIIEHIDNFSENFFYFITNDEYIQIFIIKF